MRLTLLCQTHRMEAKMRRFLSVVSLALTLPLAACFDVDITADFSGADSAEMTMVMRATPEFTALATQSGEDLCKDGDGALEADGSYVCTDVVTGTIDEIAANPDFKEGMRIERRDGGALYVEFDLGDLTKDIQIPEDDGAEEMRAMMIDSFEGHAISITVRGKEILESNGVVSEDGTSARFDLDLTALLKAPTEVPEAFGTLLVPGS